MNVNPWQFKLLEFYGLRVPHLGQWRVHAFMRRWLGADVNASLQVVRDGHRWVLNPSDYVESELFWLGARDAWDIFHLKRLLKPGFVIFDIGANFGHYSITLADALQRNCRVHAFEPFPQNLQRLCANIDLNGLDHVIQVHPIGLSDASGSGSMTVRPDNSGAATLAKTGSVDGVTVDLTTLDEFCTRRQIEKVDFIKIDVEGYEEKILIGGSETIRKFLPLMFIELDPPKLERAGSSVERVVGQLRKFGYGLFVSSRKHLVPLREIPRGANILNVICMTKSSAKEL